MGTERPGAGDARRDLGATAPGDPQRARVTRALEPATDAAEVSVSRRLWIKEEDYWRKITYMSATGRRPSVSPPSRALPRPDRFRRWSPLTSLVVLALVVGLVVFIAVGVVMAERVAASITLPGAVPGLTLPTTTPTHHATVTPTVPAK